MPHAILVVFSLIGARFDFRFVTWPEKVCSFSYFVAHKPANNEQLAAPLRWLPGLVSSGLITLVAAGVGYRLLCGGSELPSAVSPGMDLTDDKLASCMRLLADALGVGNSEYL